MTHWQPRTSQRELKTSSWNCFNPVKEKDECFLSHKTNRSLKEPPASYREHNRRGSDHGAEVNTPTKKSLKSKTNKSLKGSQVLSCVQEQKVKDCRSPMLSPSWGNSLWGNTQDTLFYQPQTPPQTLKMNEINKEQKVITSPHSHWNIRPRTPTSPNIKFTLLSPTIKREPIQPVKIQEKNETDPLISKISQKTTVIASNSQSLKKIGIISTSQKEKVQTPPALTFENLQEFDDSIDDAKSINLAEPPSPPTPSKQKEVKIHSTMSLDNPKKDKNQNLSYSCRNIGSQRFIKYQKNKVTRISEVEEVKSLADSQQISSDQESIVLGKLQDMIQKSTPSKNSMLVSQRRQFKNYSSTCISRLHR